MNMSNFHAHAEPNFLGETISIHLYERRNGEISILSNLQFTTVKEGNFIQPDEQIVLPRETAQELMDSLWQCGLRPSEGSGSAGAMKATENHLKDMQELTRRLMKMIEDTQWHEVNK